MSEQEKIKEVVINTKIYDIELSQKVVQAFSDYDIEFAPNIRFGLDIIFDKSVYSNVDFYKYPLTKEFKEPLPKTKEEKIHQIIDNVLSEQLDNVITAMSHIGYKFHNASIIGENIKDGEIKIILYRQEMPEENKRKKQNELSVTTIIPDRPFIFEKVSDSLARLFLEQMRKEKAEETAKKNHTINLISAEKLFSVLIDALSEDVVKCLEITVDKMLNEAYIESDWPLYIRSKRRAESIEVFTKDTQIDCPKYIIFQLNYDGSWEIKKTENLKEAQHNIIQSFRNNRTKSIVILDNLTKVSYTLFAETDNGLVYVTASNAHTYKKLHVCWNRND